MAVIYIIGAPGTGKSTYAAKIAYKNMLCKKALKKGLTVYSMTAITGTYKINVSDIGVNDMSGGMILIDEAGLTFNNREWKFTPKTVIEHFKMHRHYNEDIYIFSQQANDVDNKLQAVATQILLIRPFIVWRGKPVISSIRKVLQNCDVDEVSHQIMQMFYKKKFWIRFIYLPRWWKFFNTYEAPELNKKEFSKW